MPGDPVHLQQHADRELHLPGRGELEQLAVLEELGHHGGRRRPSTTEDDGGRGRQTWLDKAPTDTRAHMHTHKATQSLGKHTDTDIDTETHTHTCTHTHTKRHSR
jgi:hypothetical protein